MSKINEIIKFIEKNSFQCLDGDVEDMIEDGVLCFATREHGNVGDEEFSQIDYLDAQRVIVKVMAEYGHLISQYEIEACDEWVNLEITLK